MKKTGEEIEDKMYVDRINSPIRYEGIPATFKIHVPNLVNVVFTKEDFFKFADMVWQKRISSCPRCGNSTYNHRRHECACDERRCANCGWEEE